MSINYITYLAPGIPEEFFQLVVEGVSERTGTSGSLVVETGVSGPPRGSADPFSSGSVDVGFMCAPPFLWLRERVPPPVELLVAPVSTDPRCEGRPVYFSEVVVRADSGIGSFAEVRGKTFAYNDACSMSGYFGMLSRLRGMGEDFSFFEGTVCSGGHGRSLEMLLAGEVDVISSDSNALAMRLRGDESLQRNLRVLEGIGPFRIQPVVVGCNLPDETKSLLRAAFLGLDLSAEPFSRFGFLRFAPVTDEDYAAEKAALRELEQSG